MTKGTPLGHRDGHGHPEHMIPLPDYPQDQNAMHAAVETLTDIEFCKYVHTLCGHTTPGVEIQWCGEDAGRAERATARQRAEAYVKTMEANQK